MENQDRRRIQRVSGRFRRLFVALFFCLPLLDMAYWLFFNSLPRGLLIGLPATADHALSSMALLLGFLVSLIPMSVAMYAVSVLVKLFRLYERAIIFSRDNVVLFRQLGYALISWVVASMVFTTLISIVLTFGNQPGQRMIVAGFGISEFLTLMMGFLILLISWVMNEGRKLQDEQAYTV